MAVQEGGNPTPQTQAMPGGCLVLFEEGSRLPGQLMRALDARGLSAEVVRDEPGVMSGLSTLMGSPRVLVVADPGRWLRLGELIRAVHTYHPDVFCWQFESGDGGGGRGMHVSELDKRYARANGEPAVDGQTGPVGQILGRRRAVDALLVKVPGRPLSTREIVTQQELTMLLGPAPGEAG